MSHDPNQPDTRNVLDQLKGLPHELIVKTLDKRGVEFEIAIENTLRDFNMGTIVRSANAFGVRKVHVIGRRQWNKRGAMSTEKYLELVYHPSVEAFLEAMNDDERQVVAIDNVSGSIDLQNAPIGARSVLVFGQEGPGLSRELLDGASMIVAIEQLGSTRSVNVGVAAGIAMYEVLRRHTLVKQ